VQTIGLQHSKSLREHSKPLRTSKLEEIRRTAERRLQEIEPLIEEAGRLRDVISVIDQQQPADSARAQNGNGDHHASRTRKGANKRTILELVARRPGITAAEISEETDIKRTVVASTVSRLKRNGELVEQGHGVRLANGHEPA
jgi:predicted HTH transcriptional regulator